MTKEEIIEKIENNPMFPYIQPDSLEEIVEFVIENSISLKEQEPQGLDEVAKEQAKSFGYMSFDYEFDENVESFKAGAKWMAEQGVSISGRFGIRGIETDSIVEKLLDGGFKMGNNVIVQIRKKE